jgi:hypothetical protein
LPLPDSLAPGTYTVTIGWYTLPEGNRLEAMVGGESVADNQVEIYRISLP